MIERVEEVHNPDDPQRSTSKDLASRESFLGRVKCVLRMDRAREGPLFDLFL